MKLGRNLGRTFLDYYKLNYLSPRKSNKLSLEKLNLSSSSTTTSKKGAKDGKTSGKRGTENGGLKGRKDSWDTTTTATNGGGKSGNEKDYRGSNTSIAHLKMKHKSGIKS